MPSHPAEHPQSGYGAAGRLGLGTPQANPTVEAEFAILAPRSCVLLATRLTSARADPHQRLLEYLERLDQTLGAYDTLKPDAYGFACTGSSYLVGPERERELVEAVCARRGYPVFTAAEAIVWSLRRMGARSIAILAPYPESLVEAGRRYFEGQGIAVTHIDRIDIRSADTRSIYQLGWRDAAARLAALDDRGADAVLLSGTGMPSLPLVDPGAARPVISSNLCLMARLLDAVGQGGLLEEGGLAPAGWRVRLAEALGAAPP